MENEVKLLREIITKFLRDVGIIICCLETWITKRDL